MRRVVGAVVLTAVVLLAATATASTAAATGHLASGRVPAPSGGGVPAPMLILAGFAVLFVVVAAIAGAVRMFGWDPPWAVGWRHSWNEAEYRIGRGWLAMRDRFTRRTPIRYPPRRQPPV